MFLNFGLILSYLSYTVICFTHLIHSGAQMLKADVSVYWGDSQMLPLVRFLIGINRNSMHVATCG